MVVGVTVAFVDDHTMLMESLLLRLTAAAPALNVSVAQGRSRNFESPRDGMQRYRTLALSLAARFQ